MCGGNGDCFKFTPTLHVYVLRAGIKGGGEQAQKKEERPDRNKMKARRNHEVRVFMWVIQRSSKQNNKWLSSKHSIQLFSRHIVSRHCPKTWKHANLIDMDDPTTNTRSDMK